MRTLQLYKPSKPSKQLPVQILNITIGKPSSLDFESETESIKVQETRIQKLKKLWSLCGGMFMALCCSIFFSPSFLLVKILEKYQLHAFGAALIFNIGVFIPSIFFILLSEFGPGWSNRSRILKEIFSRPLNGTLLLFISLQGLLQAASVILRTLSLRYLSVGDMTVLVFSSPIVTTILAHFILGEPCGKLFILIAIFTLCGVGLITKPPLVTGGKDFDTVTLIGSGFALGAMFLLSMKFVITRKIKEQHFLALTLSGILVSLPLFLIFEPWDSLFPLNTPTFIGIYLRIGLLCGGFPSIACINLALKMEDAGVVALVRSCDVIFAFLLQYLFLSVIPDLLSGIGAIMVWTGVLGAGIMKYWNERKLKKENVTTL